MVLKGLYDEIREHCNEIFEISIFNHFQVKNQDTLTDFG